MKTVKHLLFAALAALMTVSPAFAADQGGSWWSNWWNSVKNAFSGYDYSKTVDYAKQYGKQTAEYVQQYAQQNPKTATAIGSVCAVGSAYGLRAGYGKISEARTIAAIKAGDKDAQENAIEKTFIKIWCRLTTLTTYNENNTSEKKHLIDSFRAMNGIKDQEGRYRKLQELLPQAINLLNSESKLDSVNRYMLNEFARPIESRLLHESAKMYPYSPTTLRPANQ